MQMYIGDFNDVFPAANVPGEMTDEEWIRWLPLQQFSWPAQLRSNLLTTGIVPYIQQFNTNLFTCPSDRTLLNFRRKFSSFPDYVQNGQWYPFSYTLNSPRGIAFLHGAGILHHGMAAIRWDQYGGTLAGQSQFKLTSVNNPAGKIMFVDERMVYEMKNAEINNFDGARTSGWEWPYDKLTQRHSGRGNVTFADGHVETVKPEFGQMKEHYDPAQ
jgi:prepilin-type processing-associated H-X9-DG protein